METILAINSIHVNGDIKYSNNFYLLKEITKKQMIKMIKIIYTYKHVKYVKNI